MIVRKIQIEVTGGGNISKFAKEAVALAKEHDCLVYITFNWESIYVSKVTPEKDLIEWLMNVNNPTREGVL